MGNRATAARTVLAQLEALGIVAPILRGRIRPLFAFSAGERDDDARLAFLLGHGSFLPTTGCGATVWSPRARLLEDGGDDAGADGAAALADGEAQPLLEGDRLDELDGHLHV